MRSRSTRPDLPGEGWTCLGVRNARGWKSALRVVRDGDLLGAPQQFQASRKRLENRPFICRKFVIVSQKSLLGDSGDPLKLQGIATCVPLPKPESGLTTPGIAGRTRSHTRRGQPWRLGAAARPGCAPITNITTAWKPGHVRLDPQAPSPEIEFLNGPVKNAFRRCVRANCDRSQSASQVPSKSRSPERDHLLFVLIDQVSEGCESRCRLPSSFSAPQGACQHPNHFLVIGNNAKLTEYVNRRPECAHVRPQFHRSLNVRQQPFRQLAPDAGKARVATRQQPTSARGHQLSRGSADVRIVIVQTLPDFHKALPRHRSKDHVLKCR